MDFFDLVNISERYLEIINPLTPEKVLTVGKFLRLRQDGQVIDFGCGYAEPLILWAEHFHIRGIGIDIRQHVCDRANKKLAQKGLTDRIQIVCEKGADYSFQEASFDAAVCLGATFIWNGFEPTLRAMRRAILPTGRLAIGEPYWLTDDVPSEYLEAEEHDFFTEYRLLEIIRSEGFDLEYVVRASNEDWDSYEASNWHGLIRWLEENPDHPEREDVVRHLHKNQDEYVKVCRPHMGWAVYILAPKVHSS